MGIRRLSKEGEQTHPDPKEMHPWFHKKAASTEKGDWLSNDFFWKAFCACLKKAGRTVTEKPEDLFDFQYNRDYRDWDGPEKEVRGGIEYSLPKGWKRYACRVKNKYGSDNSWLRLDGCDGEWAVAYHGTTAGALVPILEGGLKAGSAQAYQHKKDVRTGQTIGKGIYCTPSISVAESYAKQQGGVGTQLDGHAVHFVLQCRVKPDAILRCHDETTHESAYWVVTSPEDIRPYGVLVREFENSGCVIV